MRVHRLRGSELNNVLNKPETLNQANFRWVLLHRDILSFGYPHATGSKDSKVRGARDKSGCTAFEPIASSPGQVASRTGDAML